MGKGMRSLGGKPKILDAQSANKIAVKLNQWLFIFFCGIKTIL
jgi:hypothetical protein